MLSTLKDFFDSLLSPSAEAARGTPQQQLQLATAVLLVEVMRAEPTIGEAERHAAVAALHEQFGLADAEVKALLDLATQTSDGASDYFAFTSRINEGFDMAQKLQIVEQMWRVAYADGRLDAAENHVMRKIADLLYIPQGAYVNAKLRARETAGSG